ncbi:hypothetical protein E2C01_009048 [Portunus trituberculatus]|uniref:Uncharacterized protein n=1 Tax=Portunus trituberculatus TaxID=210409 RepID=A0A5B7D2E4_PORTR|nr:hypothetical protein [Portunus trituberculatus]
MYLSVRTYQRGVGSAHDGETKGRMSAGNLDVGDLPFENGQPRNACGKGGACHSMASRGEVAATRTWQRRSTLRQEGELQKKLPLIFQRPEIYCSERRIVVEIDNSDRSVTYVGRIGGGGTESKGSGGGGGGCVV